MSFKVLYVEDEKEYSDQVEKAVAMYLTSIPHSPGQSAPLRPVEIKSIRRPEDLARQLDKGYDLVLADICFRTPTGEDQKRLDEIIKQVKAWAIANRLGKPMPIIAYTRREKATLDYCLNFSESLYDIWDKATASPPYVAFRLTSIAAELARYRPDSLLQGLIRKMHYGAKWHWQVKEMTRQYNAGWTESDQIDRIASCIGAIGIALNTTDQCKAFWDIVAKWEPLGRATSENSRGHARHVINVFWMGYYLIHHPLLQGWFESAWSKLITTRMVTGKDLDPMAGISAAWFYAALFHDMGSCVEKSHHIQDTTQKLLNHFSGFFPEVIKGGTKKSKSKKSASGSDSSDTIPASTKKLAHKLFHAMGGPVVEYIIPLWENSIAQGHPDHGVVAAIHLINSITDPEQSLYAFEAARAMAIHNLISSLDSKPSTLISWEDDPIAALLLLCDQLQTWDRDTGKEKLSDRDGTERAELANFSVENSGAGLSVKLDIDYLGPKHLDQSEEMFARVKLRLEEILQKHPYRALRRIQSPWPFTITARCWLNSRPIGTTLEFGK